MTENVAGSCRDSQFQVADSQVGMKDGQQRISMVLFCPVEVGVHLCTFQSNKRFGLKTTLDFRLCSFSLRVHCFLHY